LEALKTVERLNVIVKRWTRKRVTWRRWEEGDGKRLKVKGKVVPVIFLNELHAVKAY
jgi:hypothetical protein